MTPNETQTVKRVLLVDDDHMQLADMSQYLTRCGFKVMTCEDGDEAIAAMEGVPFDVVVSDVQMPRVNGLTLAEWTSANRPELRVFIMTAFGSSELYERAMQRGIGLYLEKPVDPKLLVELLNSPPDRSESREVLVGACLEASDNRGSGEVVVRSGDEVGRVFFTEGQIAWATATSMPHTFTGALAERIGLTKEDVDLLVRKCQTGGRNIFDELVQKGHLGDEAMKRLLLESIGRCFVEICGWPDPRAMYIPMKRTFGGKIAFELADVLRTARALGNCDNADG